MSGKYATTVIDPPWKIQPYRLKGFGGCETLPYETMADAEILDFPIDDFAAERSLLFLWTTSGKLPAALAISTLWGFKYLATLAWDKIAQLNGNGLGHRLEYAVIATRGGAALDFDYPLPTLIKERKRQHSRKPDKFYQLLLKSTPAPRIDIFARYRHYGFEAWGDEAQPSSPTLEAWN